MGRPHSFAAQQFDAPSGVNLAGPPLPRRMRGADKPARLRSGEDGPLPRWADGQHDLGLRPRQQLNPLRRGTIKPAAIGDDKPDRL